MMFTKCIAYQYDNIFSNEGINKFRSSFIIEYVDIYQMQRVMISYRIYSIFMTFNMSSLRSSRFLDADLEGAPHPDSVLVVDVDEGDTFCEFWFTHYENNCLVGSQLFSLHKNAYNMANLENTLDIALHAFEAMEQKETKSNDEHTEIDELYKKITQTGHTHIIRTIVPSEFLNVFGQLRQSSRYPIIYQMTYFLSPISIDTIPVIFAVNRPIYPQLRD